MGVKTLLPDLTRSSGGDISILVLRVVLVDLWLLRALRRAYKLSVYVGDSPAPYLLGSTVAGKIFPYFSLSVCDICFERLLTAANSYRGDFPGFDHLLDSPLPRGGEM